MNQIHSFIHSFVLHPRSLPHNYVLIKNVESLEYKFLNVEFAWLLKILPTNHLYDARERSFLINDTFSHKRIILSET